MELGYHTWLFQGSYTMTTKITMALRNLAEKGADADLLQGMIQFVAQRMMDMDAESLDAGRYPPNSSFAGS